MATKTVTLTLDQAQQVKAALEVASDTVIALEWISAQKGETNEMTGALETIKACNKRLSIGLGDSYWLMDTALMDAAKEAAHV